MRTEEFTETLPVKLEPADVAMFARRATAKIMQIRKHATTIETETEAWKLRKKQLELEKTALEAEALSASEAAETGIADLPVKCHEELVGVMVVTRRLDTKEVVGSREATKAELNAQEKPPMVPGGGAKTKEPKGKKRATPAEDDGVVPDDCCPQAH